MKNILSNINLKNIINAILIILIIPNIIIWLCIIFFQPPIERAIFNIDYLLPIILYIIPKKPTKILAILLFVIVYAVDILVIALQCLPYDMGALNFFYLFQDLMKGPSMYRSLFYLVLFIGCLEVFSFVKFALKTNFKSCLLLTALLIVTLPIFPKIVNSQIPYLVNNVVKDLSKVQDTLYLKPTPFKNVTEPWHTALKSNQPISRQILFVLAESWGYSNDAILEEQLKVLKSRTDYLEYLKQGTNNSKEATLVAEFSELCDASFTNYNNLLILRKEYGFDNCLPNLLDKKGYKTISLHSNIGVIYSRMHWYPLAGFQTILFGNDVDLPKNSMNGGAIFDPDLIPVVAKEFEDKKQKVFYYWLTYTSHQPYPTDEIKNHRFSCEKFNIKPDTEACRNMMLNSQFTDALADLVLMPEMKGVEVIVVGDHRPLFIFKYGENAQFFDMTKVSWVHFKIKDK